MLDLNDLFFYAAVVKHRGFSAGARALGIPKSRVSKHIAALEERLGVRLLERSSRSFEVTDIGWAIYEQCQDVVASADAAEALVAEARSESKGLIRISAPTGLAHRLTRLLPEFLSAHPLVSLQLLLLNRPVNVIEERIDIALRIRSRLDTDPQLIMRKLGTANSILVASPQLIAEVGGSVTLDSLPEIPSLVLGDHGARPVWPLVHSDGRTTEILMEPRFVCSDFDLLRCAALAGLGVSLLPEEVCSQDIADGSLVRVLPDWIGATVIVHAIFTARHGLPPAVRALIDHLAEEFEDSRDDALDRVEVTGSARRDAS